MPTPFDDIYTVRSDERFLISSSDAYRTGLCPACGAHQFAVIGYSAGGNEVWARCVACHAGIVQNADVQSPEALPLREPSGLPETEKRVWGEARRCLSVNANAAAVMLCRKILFHVAVTHGLEAKDEKGWAPSFKECTDHLLAEGLITARMKPWVDRIKDVGNEANHEIEPISPAQASDVAAFTQKLLELAYEMDDAMSKAEPRIDESTPA